MANSGVQSDLSYSLAALRSELTAAEEKLRRLYRLVEEGEDESDDLLKERLSALRTERDLAKANWVGSASPVRVHPRSDPNSSSASDD